MSGQPCAPYFVMAHHRSGSNFLNDVLQAHSCIECINEPLSMHTDYFRHCDLEPWTQDQYDPVLLHPSLAPHHLLRSFLLDFRTYLLYSNDVRVIGFKETVLFGKLDWLKAYLPTLKVLLLKRDPCAVVASVLRSNLLSFWDYAHLVPPAFKALHPGYVATQIPVDPAVQAAEVAAMSVAVRDDMARRSIDQFDHVEVDLTDLMNDPANALNAITNFLCVEPDARQLDFVRRRQAETRGGTFSSFRSRDDVENGWRRNLAADQVRVIQEVLQCA